MGYKNDEEMLTFCVSYANPYLSPNSLRKILFKLLLRTKLIQYFLTHSFYSTISAQFPFSSTTSPCASIPQVFFNASKKSQMNFVLDTCKELNFNHLPRNKHYLTVVQKSYFYSTCTNIMLQQHKINV